MLSRRLVLPLLLAAAFAAPAFAQGIPPAVDAAVKDAGRPAADTARDADRKPAESVAFSGVKPGDKVLELLAGGGYYTRILAKTVGPRGHVYATIGDAMLTARPASADPIKAIAADPAYGNVSLLVHPMGAPKPPEPVDVAWTSDNYHDLHNPGNFSAGDMVAFNKAIFAALKPGGTYIVVDYAGAQGTGTTQTASLHRIDPDAVKQEVTAAGFVFVAASPVVMRADDNLTGKSGTKVASQFTFKFRKP